MGPDAEPPAQAIGTGRQRRTAVLEATALEATVVQAGFLLATVAEAAVIEAVPLHATIIEAAAVVEAVFVHFPVVEAAVVQAARVQTVHVGATILQATAIVAARAVSARAVAGAPAPGPHSGTTVPPASRPQAADAPGCGSPATPQRHRQPPSTHGARTEAPAMITHLVLFRPRVAMSAEERVRLVTSFVAAVRAIPTVRHARLGRRLTVGADYETRPKPDFTVLVALDFDDLTGLRAYLDHPAHAAPANHLYEVMDDGAIYDFDVLEDEALSEAQGW